jgi:hypothetical protein
LVPFIRLAEGGSGDRIVHFGQFGAVPPPAAPDNGELF